MSYCFNYVIKDSYRDTYKSHTKLYKQNKLTVLLFDYKQIIRDFCLAILLLLLKINTLKLITDLLDGLEIQKKLPTLMTFSMI